MIEEWKQVPGASAGREVSSLGRYRIDGEIVEPGENTHGYKVIYVRGRTVSLHRMIMEAFVGPCPDVKEVCHYDGDRLNNRLDNLRYDTHQANMQDMRRKGTEVHGDLIYCPRGHRRGGANEVPRRRERHGDDPCLACSRARSIVARYPDLDIHFDDISDIAFDYIVAGEDLWGDLVEFVTFKFLEFDRRVGLASLEQVC